MCLAILNRINDVKMTADRNYRINHNPDPMGELLAINPCEDNQSIGAMDMQKRDRFELLSAYLDGEVTAFQRRQVEEWLANDQETQQLYERLLNLRQGMQTMPCPAGQQVEDTIEQVYKCIHRRRRRALLVGGSAIAAAVIGAISTVLPSRQLLQMAQSPTTIEPLMVALNSPVVEIPKAGIAPLGQPSQPLQPGAGQHKDVN